MFGAVFVTTAATAVVAFGFGFVFGRKKYLPEQTALQEAQTAATAAMQRTAAEDELKMVLLVRTDLKMSSGKIAAQCGHAVLGAYKQATKRTADWVRKWERFGQAKIALKVPDEEQMESMYKQATEAGLPAYIVVDAGRTQIPANSRTVLAIGPAPVKLINELTSSLKLL
eukprot:TRINITY_DN695_c0_g1_i1.p2 TRINITY_DN695_c0_g1~~TRINITY_DN695_c0_g1_i1.p2  ORF type:complete len:170 (+),score=40.30 TRINITY_DN695_c0_g1_i1:362-871(+)